MSAYLLSVRHWVQFSAPQTAVCVRDNSEVSWNYCDVCNGAIHISTGPGPTVINLDNIRAWQPLRKASVDFNGGDALSLFSHGYQREFFN